MWVACGGYPARSNVGGRHQDILGNGLEREELRLMQQFTIGLHEEIRAEPDGDDQHLTQGQLAGHEPQLRFSGALKDVAEFQNGPERHQGFRPESACGKLARDSIVVVVKNVDTEPEGPSVPQHSAHEALKVGVGNYKGTVGS